MCCGTGEGGGRAQLCAGTPVQGGPQPPEHAAEGGHAPLLQLPRALHGEDARAGLQEQEHHQVLHVLTELLLR
jgi:hypothetical protein